MYGVSKQEHADMDTAIDALALIARTIAKRTESGLYLDFIIPGREGPWRCFPSSEAVKAKWIENGARKGWTLAQ
jgi:hypothetical protein